MFHGLFELLELKLIEDIILLFGTKNITYEVMRSGEKP